MATDEAASGQRWVLLARETEPLGRVAERIQKRRRVVVFLVCERAHRGDVLAWLSKRTGRDLEAPVESPAAELLDRLELAAVGSPPEVVSLAWPPGDRGAIAGLNLHREKLRRGSSVLLWCAPEDLGALQTEGQDAYSFRDTTIIVTGFPIPTVHVPSDDTPEIRLARARLDLPGTPFEKALAAAELGTFLLDRGYYAEAARVCDSAIAPVIEDSHEAGRETIAYLTATRAAALAAVGAVSDARSWTQYTLANLLQARTWRDDLVPFLHAVEPTSETLFAAARTLQGYAADLPWESHRRHLSVSAAGITALTGVLRTWRPRGEDFPFGRDVCEAEGLIALARGDIDEAIGLFLSAAAGAARRDEDNRSPLLCVVDGLIAGGEVVCAALLLQALRSVRKPGALAIHPFCQDAHILVLAGDVEKARRLVQFKERPPVFVDGRVYKHSAALVSVVRAAFQAARLRTDDVSVTASYLSEVEAWFPPPDEGVPPFYPVLFPGLRADLLSLIPERRAEATELARTALDLARAKVPRYAPDHAAKLIRCLFLQERFDDALDAVSAAEGDAEQLEHLRALSALRVLRVVVHVRRGDGAPAVDAAMAALRETLEATGSPRIASENLLELAAGLPPECAHPDMLTLIEEAAECFAEMPMPFHEELCREIRGDALLARGQREEAAACYAGAGKRLAHYGLVLRVPLLGAKREAASG